MAKARVDLKGIAKAVDKVTTELAALRKKSATRAAKSELAALERRLVEVKALVARECPPGMFRAFELGEAAGARTRRRAVRKSTRK